MARGRMVKTTCKCGGDFQIISDVDDIKVALKCADCGAEKEARRDKVPDSVEDISADVAATIAAATSETEVAVDETDVETIVVEEANDNLEEVAVD